MKRVNRLFLSIFTSLLAVFSIQRVDAQVWPCNPQNLNTPPEISITDIIINGQSVYGLSTYPFSVGSTYQVEIYFLAGGGSGNTNPMHTRVYMDTNLSGTYDSGEGIASPIPVPSNSGYTQFSMTIPASAGDAAMAFVLSPEEAAIGPNFCQAPFIGAWAQLKAKVNPYNQLLSVASDPDPQTIFNGTLPVMPSDGVCFFQQGCNCFYNAGHVIPLDLSSLEPGLYRIKVGLKEQELIINPPQGVNLPAYQVDYINRITDCANADSAHNYVISNEVVSNWVIIPFEFNFGTLFDELPHFTNPNWGNNSWGGAMAPPYLRMQVELQFHEAGVGWESVGILPPWISSEAPGANEFAGPAFEQNVWYCYDEDLECGDTGSQGYAGRHAQENQLPSATSSFSLYPNPSSGLIHIDYTLSQKSTAAFTLIDFQGRTVLSETIDPQLKGSYQEQLDLSPFPKGIYLLQYLSQDGVQVKRLLKE